MTISLASFAISVPSNIENPTSLLDKAGASLVPSPVTATILSISLKPRTKAYLCIGWLLAITFRFLVKSWNFILSLIVSFLIGFFSVLVVLAICSASASVLGHLHKLVSFLHTLHINPPIAV